MILKITAYFQAGKISPWGNHDGHTLAVNENGRKPHLKSEKWIRAAPNFLSTIPPCSIRQQDRVQVQKIYRKKDNRLLSSSIKREIYWKFHVVVVQWQHTNVPKRVP